VNDPAVNTQAAVTEATQQFRAQVGHISRQSGVYFAGILFTTGFGYIFKIYLARVLGAQDLGLYALGVTLMGFFGIFNSLGLPQSAVRFVASYYAAGKYGQAGETLDRAAELDPYEPGHGKRLEMLRGRIDEHQYNRIANRFHRVDSKPEAAAAPAVPEPAAAAPVRESEPTVLEDFILQAEIYLQYGMRSKALERLERVSKLFPPMTVHLISSGESSGELDAMLDRAATNQERELDSMMGALVGLLGPLLIVVMGLFVMGIVFAMLMPIFEMNNYIR
jgi:tetratricopeptide (TPR) repeat protein